MFRHTNRAYRALGLVVGPALLVILGCSDDGLGKRYSVSGTVEYKGQPVKKARINFVSAKAGAAGASGDVVDGQFGSMTTLSPGDGVLAGDYKVTVDDRTFNEDELKAKAQELAKKNKMDGMGQIPQELHGAALKKAKSSIPGKYQIPETSDLSAKVDESNTTFKFELKD